MNGDLEHRIMCVYCNGEGWLVLHYVQDTNEHVAFCDECLAVHHGPKMPPRYHDVPNINDYCWALEVRRGHPVTTWRVGWLRSWPVPPPKPR